MRYVKSKNHSQNLVALWIIPGRRILSFSLICKKVHEPKHFQNHWVRQTIINLTQSGRPCPSIPPQTPLHWRDECGQNPEVEDFPGGPVVKNPCLQRGRGLGAGSIPSWETNAPKCHVVWPKIKNKERQTSQEIQELQLHAPNAGCPGS